MHTDIWTLALSPPWDGTKALYGRLELLEADLCSASGVENLEEAAFRNNRIPAPLSRSSFTFFGAV
jgi:hypothetical protein